MKTLIFNHLSEGSGDKFQLAKDIRDKTIALREAEEKIETLKRRENQIRETCEAWKSEVYILVTSGFSKNIIFKVDFYITY